MNLSQAKKEAAARSSASKKPQFIQLLEGGGTEITEKLTPSSIVKFENGSEVPLPKEEVKEVKKAASKEKSKPENKSKTKKQKTMAKTVKKSARKTSKKSSTPRAAVTINGPKKEMTARQLRSAVEKGEHVYNKNGTRIPFSVRAKQAPMQKFTVKVGKDKEGIAYQLVAAE